MAYRFKMTFVWSFALFLALACCGSHQAVALTDKEMDAFTKLPPPHGCRVIDFDHVEIIPGFVNDTWFAVVSGTRPWATMTVDLIPRVYVRQPEY
jgi:hypothetical protein